MGDNFLSQKFKFPTDGHLYICTYYPVWDYMGNFFQPNKQKLGPRKTKL